MPVVARRVWLGTWEACPWLSPEADGAMVAVFAEAVAERAVYVAELGKRGVLLEEPIVTPRGDVVGTRLVTNPAERMLRRVEVRIERQALALGLTPGARARLGLAQVELGARVARLMAPRRNGNDVA